MRFASTSRSDQTLTMTDTGKAVTTFLSWLAGIASLAYAAGITIFAIRLALNGVPTGFQIASSLPRELIITTGTGQVVLPVVLVWGVYAFLRRFMWTARWGGRMPYVFLIAIGAVPPIIGIGILWGRIPERGAFATVIASIVLALLAMGGRWAAGRVPKKRAAAEDEAEARTVYARDLSLREAGSAPPP